MRIAVILPVEERFDPVEGGAIARWVAQVYEHISDEVTIFAQQPVNGRGYPTPAWTSRLTAIVDAVLTKASAIAARRRKADPVRARSKAYLMGMIWVLLIFPSVRSASLIHVHNRPTYVMWLRRLGYRGRILLHMHNALEPGRRAHRSEYVRAADAVVFCSEYIRKEGVAAYGANIRASGVIYNGIDTDASPHPIRERNLHRLVIAGRLVPEKGAAEAIGIAEALHARGLPVSLTIVGSSHFGSDHKSAFVEALEAQAARVCEAAGREFVTMTGHLEHGELLELLKSSGLFLYPCQWEEPFGMVIAEAMACGTPPLPSRIGGVVEVLGPDLTAELCSNATRPDEFVERAAAILGQPAVWKVLSARCHQRARDNFKWGQIAQRLHEAFAEFFPDLARTS